MIFSVANDNLHNIASYWTVGFICKVLTCGNHARSHGFVVFYSSYSYSFNLAIALHMSKSITCDVFNLCLKVSACVPLHQD